MGKLTARKVGTVGPGKHGDGNGLQLVVGPTGARKWVLRYMVDGRAREMGLGGVDVVGLAEARELAGEARKLAKRGIDPIAERRKERGVPLFGDFADGIAKDLGEGFRNEKHRAQWVMTLRVYAEPLRAKPVDAIETADVLAVLRPIWQEKAETASRVRGRIERVLNAAKAKGYRTGENPAAWRGHLENLLPKRSNLTRGHHAAMAYQDVPAFLDRLREREAIAARALEFAVLTAARSGEVLGAQWSEVDLGAGVWTVPADRMKAGRKHTVPLSDAALAVLRKMAEGKVSDFVFPGQRADAPLSVMALEMVLRRMGIEDATVHGFRSAFRDWAGNETDFPRELAEHALAHVIGDKAEQAYRRGDALERRRALMTAWAAHCDPAAPASNVTRFRARTA